MNKSNWELTSYLGYTFEFINKNDPNTVITLMAKSKKEAWEKICRLS